MNMRNLSNKKVTIKAGKVEDLKEYFQRGFTCLTRQKVKVDDVVLEIHPDYVEVPNGFALFVNDEDKVKDVFIANTRVRIINDYPGVHAEVTVSCEKDNRDENLLPNNVYGCTLH